MKANIDSGILALKSFLEIVNTREKALLFVMLWALIGAGGLTYRFATIETIERLMKANCEVNYQQMIREQTNKLTNPN